MWLVISVVVVVRAQWVRPEASSTPPRPEVYAEKDAGVREAWLREGITSKRPQKFENPLDELRWHQWHNPTCHSVAHSIGKKIYEAQLGSCEPKLQRAIAVCEYRCTGGCLHGAFGAYALDSLKGKCASLVDVCRDVDFIALGECVHAVGHAVAIAFADVPPALGYCDREFRTQPESRSLAHFCATGATMQLGKRLGLGDPTQVATECAKLPRTATASCFYYGLRAKWSKIPADFRALCDSRQDSVVASCVFGAASAAMFSNAGRTSRGLDCVRRCERLQPALRRACIDGLVFRAGKYFDATDVDTVCANFSHPEDRALCRDVSGAGMYSMGKENLIARYQDSNDHQWRVQLSTAFNKEASEGVSSL